MKRQKMIDPYSFAQGIFLARLERLIRLYREYCGDKPDLNAWGRLMLERAIDATYRDCIEYGCADMARPIMAAHRRRAWEGQK